MPGVKYSRRGRDHSAMSGSRKRSRVWRAGERRGAQRDEFAAERATKAAFSKAGATSPHMRDIAPWCRQADELPQSCAMHSLDARLQCSKQQLQRLRRVVVGLKRRRVTCQVVSGKSAVKIASDKTVNGRIRKESPWSCANSAADIARSGGYKVEIGTKW